MGNDQGHRNKALAALLCAALVGCAASHPQVDAYSAWAAQTRHRAEIGEVKWSDYYRQAYDRLQAIPDNSPEKLSLMRVFADLLPQARAYERGEITRDQFDDARRQANLADQERRTALARQRQRDAATMFPTQTNCIRVGAAVNCQTY